MLTVALAGVRPQVFAGPSVTVPTEPPAEAQAVTWLYRVLFLLYAEARAAVTANGTAVSVTM